MRSKVASDVLESLEFLCCAQLFGIAGTEEAITKCLPLIWSQDERLRNAVVSTYVRLYLKKDIHSKLKDHSKEVVQNLLQITSNATSGELASLEKLIGLVVSAGHVPASALKELWQIYHQSTPGKQKLESVLACQLLSMAIPGISSSSGLSNFDRMMSSGLVQSEGKYTIQLNCICNKLLFCTDLLLAKHTCSAIKKLTELEKGVRLSSNHSLFNQISFLLTSNFNNLETTQWIPLCEQGLNVVYELSELPNTFSEALLRDLSQALQKFQGENTTLT